MTLNNINWDWIWDTLKEIKIHSRFSSDYALLIWNQNELIKKITIIGIASTAIIGIIILLNQRKIRKELRQLREMMENQDKPQE